MQKTACCMTSFLWSPINAKLICCARNQNSDFLRGMRIDWNRFWGNLPITMKIFCIFITVIITGVYTAIKTHQTVHLSAFHWMWISYKIFVVMDNKINGFLLIKRKKHSNKIWYILLVYLLIIKLENRFNIKSLQSSLYPQEGANI